MLDRNFSYVFPAIRGVQASREYYVMMCPLKLVTKIFLNDIQELPPDYRAQRVINKARVPEITKYIIDNPYDYVFSSLTASIDGSFEFIPYDATNSYNDIGTLIISMDSKFLINDGQHRRAAIEEALKLNESLYNETISIVFFEDKGLNRSQQMFADLNKHAVNTTKSIGILYDNRDPLSTLAKKTVDLIPLLKTYTDKEVDSLSKFSPKIFTLTNLHNSICRILHKQKGDNITEDEERFVIEFWRTLCEVIKEWNDVKSKNLNAAELRKNYIHAHGVVLEAFGLLGNHFYENQIKNYKKYIKKLNEIDWSRANTQDWEGRAITNNGRINKNTYCIKLTYCKIKSMIGIPLSNEEYEIESVLTKQSEDYSNAK